MTFSLHVFGSHGELELADSLLCLLQLVFQVTLRLLQRLILLFQVEFNDVLVFELHFFRLNFSHLVKHFVLFRTLRHLRLSHSGHESIILLAQLNLVILLHAQLVLQR